MLEGTIHTPEVNPDGSRYTWLIVEGRQSQHTTEDMVDYTDRTTMGWSLMCAGNSHVLQITDISPMGLIGKWNRLHPEDEVQVGDWVAGVNGYVRVQHKLMELEQRTRHEAVSIVIMRPSAQHSEAL